MGRRPSRGRGIGHVSIQVCSAPRALPAAHFDRNESHVSYGRDIWSIFDGALVMQKKDILVSTLEVFD